jgi:hypothetical protein
MSSLPASPQPIFFGYPSRPESLREAMGNGARRIGELPDVIPINWEDLKVSGQVVIDEVLDAIDASALVVLELTHLNLNVLFELGYAIGSNHRVWPLRDPSDEEADRKWQQLGLLTTLGYSTYTNSDQVLAAFLKDLPLTQSRTLFERLIADVLEPTVVPSVFYVPSAYPTEVGRALTERILDEKRRGLRYVADDATEGRPQSLSWYMQSVSDAAAVVAHLVEARRTDADVHNARAALATGLAVGMRKPALLFDEDDQLAPIDYRDRVVRCRTSKECAAALDAWLGRTLAPVHASLRRRSDRTSSIRLATELRGLRLGDPVAENEEDSLSAYFLETASFREVLADRATVFVGRKGSGKTANLLEAADRLRTDTRNLVCIVKPVWYEWESLLRLLTEYERRDSKGYMVQSLWKLLVYSEVASQASQELLRRPLSVPRTDDEENFLAFIQGRGSFVMDEFAVRLEHAVGTLLSLPAPAGVAEQRVAISEALHDGALRDLREHLGRVLSKRRRVAILVDNLDKGWESGADLKPLATFLLGLLTSVTRVADDFHHEDHWREPVNVSLAVFLRSDIFSHVLRVATEPDKIPVSRLIWADGQMLARVVEERFVAARSGKADPAELWTEYFTPEVKGVATRDYLVQRVLPRPRDIIVFASAAIASAINHGSGRVEEADVLRGEQEYSRFAFEAIQVEDVGSKSPLEPFLYELVGETARPTEAALGSAFGRAGASPDEVAELIERLVKLGILGLETHTDQFAYTEDEGELRRNQGLADKIAREGGRVRRFEIHRAFRAFLEITE